MTTSNFKIGNTISVNNKNYSLVQIDVTADKFPNIKKNNPNIDLHIIIKGAKGALKAGFITITGNVVLF